MYWEQAGAVNTEATINLALKRAGELGISNLVVATCSGETLKKVAAQATDLNIVGVSHHVGFDRPGIDELSPATRQELEARGIKVLTTTHLLAGIDRALRIQFGGLYPAEIIGSTLRLFGQGVKVGVEIVIMALDAGLIPYGEEIIGIAGTGSGADSAVVVRPNHSNKFFQTEIREIICMPRSKHSGK